jgi:hypothetical protein
VAIGAPILSSLHISRVYSWGYETEPNTAIVAGAVPEPSVWMLACIAMLSWVGHRNRSRCDTLQR